MSPLLLAVVGLLMLVLLLRGIKLYVSTIWRWERLTKDIPGPYCYPIIGTTLLLEKPNNLLFKLRDLWYQLGDTVKVWLGPMLFVVITDPDDVEMFCTHPAMSEKPWIYNAVQAVLGKGLITINNPMHRVHRKVISTSMHLDILKGFVQVFGERGLELSQRLRPFAERGEVFDLTPYLGFCVNHSLCDTVLSTDMKGVEADRDELIRVADKASWVVMHRLMRPWCWSDSMFRLVSRRHGDYASVVHGMKEFVQKVFNIKVEMLRKGQRPETKRRAFLDHVLASDDRAVLSEAEIKEELRTLIWAGSTTTTDLLSFFFVTVSLLPDIQKKIHEELDEVFGDDRTRPIVFDDLQHLQYLERCIKETLRLFPPVCVIGRAVKEDLKLKKGYTLPKGSIALVVPYATQRNPEWFPDPERFDPDRFLLENCTGRHPFAYVPFSAGSRNCVGMRYALMSMKTQTASVLRHYTVHPNPNGPKTLYDINVQVGLSMVPDGGARVSLRPRPLLADS